MTATIFPGHTYAVNGAITPENLTALMGDATIAGVSGDEMTAGFRWVTASIGQPSPLRRGELWWDKTNNLMMTRYGSGIAGICNLHVARLTYSYIGQNAQIGDVLVVEDGADDSVALSDFFNTTLIAGIALESASDGGLIAFAMAGIVDVRFSASTTRGHYAIVDPLSNGRALSSSSATTPAFGIVMEARTGAGLAKVLLNFPRGT